MTEIQIPSYLPQEDTQSLEEFFQKTRLGWVDYRTARDLIRLSGLEQDSEALYPLLLSLFLALNEGSLCLPLEEETLTRRLSALVPQDMRESVAREILEGIRLNKWRELIAREEEDFLPLIIHHEGEKKFLYFQKYNAKEKQLAEDFARLLEVPNEQVPVDRVRSILEETLTQSPVRRGKDPVHLNIQQKIALCFSILQRVTIVSGGPGTGKTSIVVSLLRALVRMGVPIDRVRLAAPTGRAANRMSESIRSAIDSIETPSENDLALGGLEGMTLHRLLKYRGGAIPFRYHRFNPLPADLVVIDEVSMVDVILMADLISAIRPGTRLILLGDKDQLPSVEAGAVLGNLIPGLTQTCLSAHGKQQVESLLGETIETPHSKIESKAGDRVILLDTSYRSEATILSVAGEINRGDLRALEQLETHRLRVEIHPHHQIQVDWPLANRDPGGLTPGRSEGGVRWIDASDKGTMDWMGILDSWIDFHFLSSQEGVRPFFALTGKPLSSSVTPGTPEEDRLRALFKWLESSRILSLPRKGPYGVEWVNRHVSAKMKEATGYGGRGDLYPGLPILILQNDLSLGLFNGDIGVLLRSDDRSLRAFFPQGSSFISHSLSSLPRFESAYAITVHKSQGSEYDRVLFVLPDDPDHALLSREMIYTGLTRAKSLVVLFGREDCIRVAIQRRIERDSGRNLWGGTPPK